MTVCNCHNLPFPDCPTRPDPFRLVKPSAPDAVQPEVFCGYCGALNWTIKQWGQITHKHSCPQNPVPHEYCQGDCRKQVAAPSAPASAARRETTRDDFRAWYFGQPDKAYLLKAEFIDRIRRDDFETGATWTTIERALRFADHWAAEQTRQLREDYQQIIAGLRHELTDVQKALIAELHDGQVEINAAVQRAQAAEAERDELLHEREAQTAKRQTILLDDHCVETIKGLSAEGGEEISFGGVMGGVKLKWQQLDRLRKEAK